MLVIFLQIILLACHESIEHKAENPASYVNEQNKPVGGGCDGCELIFTGMPAQINPVDTSVAWHEKGQKLLVTGVVLKPDGRTPASDIIVYYYHTDHTGHYSKGNKPTDQTLHGRIRGWVKTDLNGRYAIYTSRPVPYPGNNIPAHIHIIVKEPGINEYYIDEFVFDDDTLLTDSKRRALENRGGSGILRVVNSGNTKMAEHNIQLGLNIPNYPK